VKLLLVEDDPLNVELFTAVLEGDGHAVTVESRGIEGRDRALADRFDLILLDIQLPGMTGDSVCTQLREAGVTSPIVALSASALPTQVAHGLASGFDAYLTKPIGPYELRAAVRTYGAPQD
jgi:DNA-binding response OmpR family regulator